MSKKIVTSLIMAVLMLVIAAVCIGLVLMANPEPKYEVKSYDTPIVMEVNGEPVHANEFATYMISNKLNYENQLAQFGADASVWDDPETGEQFRESLRTGTIDTVIQYRVIDQKFRELGLKLSREDIKNMKDYRQSVVQSSGGDALFQITLAAQGLSEEMFDNSLVISAYVQKINEYYFGENGIYNPSEEEMLSYFHDNYLQAKHILIKTVDDAYQPLPEDELAAKVQLAQDVLAKVEAGEDFDELLAEYNEDPGMTMYVDGYTFTEGEMVDAFYNGTLALAENEVSGLVESEYGYHIIKRLPLDESAMEDYASEIAAQVSGKDLSSLLQEWIDEADYVIHEEEMAKITFDNLYSIANPQLASDDTDGGTDNVGTDDGTESGDPVETPPETVPEEGAEPDPASASEEEPALPQPEDETPVEPAA